MKTYYSCGSIRRAFVLAAFLSAGYDSCESATLPKPNRDSGISIGSVSGIKGEVYRDLLGKRQGVGATNGVRGAFFLEALPNEKSYLESIFRNWSPRVEVGSTNNVLITKTNIIDRLTGKPGVLVWARVVSQTNGVAHAVGGWHYSPEAGQESRYDLAFNGTNWIITAKKTGTVW